MDSDHPVVVLSIFGLGAVIGLLFFGVLGAGLGGPAAMIFYKFIVQRENLDVDDTAEQ